MASKEKYKKVYRTKRKIIVDNCLGGIAWGVGSIIGATIIVGLLGLLISRTRKFPVIGDAIEVIIDEVREGQEKFEVD